MGAELAPYVSQGGDGGDPTPAGRLARARLLLSRPLPRPAPFVVAAAAVAVAIAVVAGVTYFAAREFTSRAAEKRAAEEARSFAQHSSLLATGDAFNGYLLILRYADDPVLRSSTASEADRLNAMQQLLWLNTNRMQSLAVVDRSGLVLATSDRSIRDVQSSEAFKTSRADLGPANSDIILPGEGERGYVEFTAPLRADDGSVWGYIYARADPQDIWRYTLAATIDGGRNVVINSAGDFATGVPDEMLGHPWRGAPLRNGSVRADIAGVDSICGLGPIGKDTQIDYGWNVASCLPVSLIQAEASSALGDQAQVTLAVAVLAFVVAVGLLRLVMDGSTGEEPDASSEPGEAAAYAVDASGEPAAEATAEPEPTAEARSIAIGDDEPSPDDASAIETNVTQIVADVDALTLIEAYERRNAALAERLRELVQARIMIAATQADEAYRVAATDPDRGRALHRNAIRALEDLREHELRQMAYELHPGILRLGLPAALRHLAKEVVGPITLSLDIDPLADGASDRGGRITIDPSLRLALFRLIRETSDALVDLGSPGAAVTVRRSGDDLLLTVTAPPLPGSSPFDPERLRASELALEAFGGTLIIRELDGIEVSASVPAPHVEQPEPDVEPADDESDDDHAPAAIVRFTLPEGPPEVHEITESDVDGAATEPTLVTTFVLEDDEPEVLPIEADGMRDASAEETASMDIEADSPDDEDAA